MATQTNDKNTPAVRTATINVTKVTKTRYGVEAEGQYAHPAYFSHKTLGDLTIEVGMKVQVEYDLKDGRAGKYANITKVISVVGQEPVEEVAAEETAEVEKTESAAPAAPRTRKLDRKVEGVKKMRTGLSLDLGYDASAYLARSVHSGEGVEVGVRLVGAYHMDERDGETFARVTEVTEVISG